MLGKVVLQSYGGGPIRSMVIFLKISDEFLPVSLHMNSELLIRAIYVIRIVSSFKTLYFFAIKNHAQKHEQFLLHKNLKLNLMVIK